VAGILSLAVAAGSGLAIAAIHHFEQQVVKIDVGPDCEGEHCLRDIEPGPCVREACNFLVLGSDSREDLAPGQQGGVLGDASIGGERGDTIILVQVDVRNDRTVVISIPRDLRVEVPGYGADKINTALGHGPNVMVQTIEKLTGLDVNHYVQVDFRGFQRLVRALGGVPICVDRRMIDPLSGLRLRRPGCYTLNGQEALAFVRARHVHGDLIPDFARIARQQQFIRAVIHKVLSLGSLFRYPEIVKAGRSLRLDAGLNLYDLQDLSLKLADLGQTHVDFRVVPARPVEIGGISFVELIEPEAGRLFDRLGDGRRLGNLGRAEPLTPISPANVRVQVLDASSGGRAEEVARYLRRAGFAVVGPRGATPDLVHSRIYWGRNREDEQKVVASYLPTLKEVYDPDLVRASDVHVAVVIGPDFQGVDAFVDG
jgi:LCP family protein required for cell wall assembly